MKKAAAVISVFFILILLIMNVRFMLFSTYVKSQKHDFRKQAIAQNLSELIKLDIKAGDLYKNKNGFEWEKNNKELVINGVYHEVLSVSVKNGRAVVTIIPDKAENELFARYFGEQQDAQKDHTLALLFMFTFLECGHREPLTLTEESYLYPKTSPEALLDGSEKTALKPPAI